MKNGKLNETESEAVTRRLIVIRTLKAGDNKSEFARLLDILPSRWHNLERGWPLSMQVARMICNKVDGVSMGYICDGLFGDVPTPVKRQLEALEAELFPSKPRRSANR